MKVFYKILFLSVFSFFALNHNCYAVEYFLNPEVPVTIASLSSSDGINFSVVPERSYCVEIRTMNSTPYAAFQALAVSDANLTVTDSSRGNAGPPIYTPQITNFSQLARKCITVTGNPNLVENHRVRGTLTFTTGTTAGQTEAKLSDTTLFGGFNTNVANYNFLELTNNLSANGKDNGVISGTIIARNVVTDTVALTRAFTVNPGDRVDVNIHDAVGAGTFGTITVMHNGLPGSLTGYISQYKLVSSSPLNIEPVVHQPLNRISGLH